MADPGDRTHHLQHVRMQSVTSPKPAERADAIATSTRPPPGSPTGEAERPRRRWGRWALAIAAVATIGAWALVTGSQLGDDPTIVRSPPIGKQAPEFKLPALGGEGDAVRSSQFAGRLWVVNFWASWCVPCREEAPHLEAFYRRWAPRDVGLIGIVYNDREGRAKAFRDEFGLTYPQVMDPQSRAAIDFGVFGVPETFVIDERGVVMAKLIGAVGPTTLDDLLARIESGEQVTTENDRYRTQPD
jgi:cytochrome c biogenesis protein CcmG/thiol:disulfide interchange protein DsbE